MEKNGGTKNPGAATEHDGDLISIRNCAVRDSWHTVIPCVSWSMRAGEAWLVTGHNGGGKAEFIKALAGQMEFHPLQNENGQGGCKTVYRKEDVAVVSLEAAARLIEEERERDESEILDREDAGRTGRAFLCEVLGGSDRKNAPLPPVAARLESFPQVRLCGVERILDRGLRYMSTGEIRRTLLCRALLSGCRLLILSDPFAGLDAQSREILLEFLGTMVRRQTERKSFLDSAQDDFPRLILCMERFTEIPGLINRVLEFSGRRVSFCGSRTEYEELLEERRRAGEERRALERREFILHLERIREENAVSSGGRYGSPCADNDGGNESAPLIEFNKVNVGWGDNHVLKDLTWRVMAGEHWLLQGPNGSGKTTILELITGDNMQVFREDIKIFGSRRGSGETIWDIKRRLGIVSYRLHVEYRMVGGTSLTDTVISGFYDSIGLYERATDFERAVAGEWLGLAGFSGRGEQSFGSLSYGEQRAVLILRAAVKSPSVLILDEPCHGLDDDYREKILDLLDTIARTGTTTLLHVTHDPSEILDCERHVLELRPGESPMFRVTLR